MIYYAGWLFLVVISVAASLAAFVWGLRSGQFSDQDRARYLPLGKELLSEPIPVISRAKYRAHMISIFVIIVMALAAFAAAFALSLCHR
jgi:cbb3-type cytochrome oxidase maturation protein